MTAATDYTTRHVELDAAALRRAFSHHPSGVVAVCAQVDGRPIGLAASTFVPVSLDPPLVSFCIRAESTTWPRLRRVPRLGLSVLGEGHEHAVRALAGPEPDRFRELPLDQREYGALFVAGAPVCLSATVVDDIVAGDHKIIVCRVNEVLARDHVEPLVFHRSAVRRLQPH